MYLLRSSPAWQTREDLEAFHAALYQLIQSIYIISTLTLQRGSRLLFQLPKDVSGLYDSQMLLFQLFWNLAMVAIYSEVG